jgi:hypothetical protein
MGLVSRLSLPLKARRKRELGFCRMSSVAGSALSRRFTAFGVTFYAILENCLPQRSQKNAELIQGDYFCVPASRERILREISLFHLGVPPFRGRAMRCNPFLSTEKIFPLLSLTRGKEQSCYFSKVIFRVVTWPAVSRRNRYTPEESPPAFKEAVCAPAAMRPSWTTCTSRPFRS